MKYFIVIDMQNDFVTGALANKDAEATIKRIKAEIGKAKAEGAKIIFTRDTHAAPEEYLKTGEGKHLPVPHCEHGTKGWEIVPELNSTPEVTVIDKYHFGYDKWAEIIHPGDEVTICGTCTSICVSANVSVLKMIEDVEVKVICDCCSDVSKEAHKAGLKVMEMQQAILI